jgi:hypothetical protein
MSFNASAVKIYKATCSLVRFENATGNEYLPVIFEANLSNFFVQNKIYKIHSCSSPRPPRWLHSNCRSSTGKGAQYYTYTDICRKKCPLLLPTAKTRSLYDHRCKWRH